MGRGEHFLTHSVRSALLRKTDTEWYQHPPQNIDRPVVPKNWKEQKNHWYQRFADIILTPKQWKKIMACFSFLNTHKILNEKLAGAPVLDNMKEHMPTLIFHWTQL